MTIVRSARVSAAALLLAGTAAAQASTGSGIPISKDSRIGKHMTSIMAGADSLEIQLGHLAHSKGSAQGVRDYGIMLANDHTAHLAKVKDVTTDEDEGTAPTPNSVEGDRARAMLTWLQNTPASREWDTAYLRFQTQHHQNLYDLLSANITEARDDDLERLLSATLNSMIKHRDSAKSVATVLGIALQ